MKPEPALCHPFQKHLCCWLVVKQNLVYWEHTIDIIFMTNLSLLQHILNNRLQAWAWGKKDTHQWCDAFRKLITEPGNDHVREKILSAMLNDEDFVKHAALKFEYWSTAIVADRRDFFTAFLKELSQRPYRSNVLVAEIMLYTVKNQRRCLAVEFIQSNCVSPIHLQEFQMVKHAVEHSSPTTGFDVFEAVWRKGGASVQGVKSINPTLMTLMRKNVGDWNPQIVDKLLPKMNSSSLRKYFSGQPTYITDRLEHIIGLHEQMVLHKKMVQHTDQHSILIKARKM